ncbi:MAG: hypothetical protein RI972_964 [Pseudomonadota bacterium]
MTELGGLNKSPPTRRTAVADPNPLEPVAAVAGAPTGFLRKAAR